MSTISAPHADRARRLTHEPSLLQACGRAVADIEWQPLLPIIVFVLLTHAVVHAILAFGGAHQTLWPENTVYLLRLKLMGVVLTSMYVLIPQIVVDLREKLKGREPTPFASRLANLCKMIVCGWVLVLLYTGVVMANAKLKPAIHHLNPTYAANDAWLEEVERGLFGGVLPTEWAIAGISWLWLGVLELVYNRFALFALISLMIAVNARGMRGGARLVLALAIGLFTTLLTALAFPSRGPLFIHPEWFGALAGHATELKAQLLLMSVHDFVADPPVVRIIGGISAMPSYHVLCWTCGLLCWRGLPKWVIAIGVTLVAANWISTVVLGWHYFLDGLVGFVLAFLCMAIAGKFIPDRAARSDSEAVGAIQATP